MAPLKRILVVGGGVGGMTAALQLARIGVGIDLVEIDPEWRPYGAGLTITGPSLRALDDLGVLDEVRERGFVGAGIRLVTLDGKPVPAPVRHSAGLLDSTGGILRAELHDILSRRVRAAPIRVRLGLGLRSVEKGDAAADVAFTDDSVDRYDLVVAADGINSRVRRQLFPEAPQPRFTGQGCWRVVAPRPANMEAPEIVIGGPLKLGLVPISRDAMYMFALEHVPDNPRYADEESIPHLRRIMAPYGGNAGAVRDGLGPHSLIKYRPLEWLILAAPWYRGRVLLIGDAAHATTPHLASGAGMAIEDGIVLAQELDRADTVEAALNAFMARRFDRAREVVERSVRIGESEMARENPMIGAAMMGETMAILQAPY